MLAKLLANTDWPYCYTTCLACEDYLGRRPLEATQHNNTNKVLRPADGKTPAHVLEATATVILYSKSGHAANTANDRRKVQLRAVQPAGVGI